MAAHIIPSGATDPAALLDQLTRRIGAAHVLRGGDAAPYCTDWRGLFHGEALAVLRPADTRDVAECVRLCAAHRVAVVPQGGNTGLCGGATPGDGQIVLSLARLDRVLAIDPTDMVLTAQAGLTLQAARAAVAETGLCLPLSIASEGSAQIGGVLATNAGGTAALRHGSARDLMLGLEVVLADGRIWNGLRRLRKDNTGYALAQLFAGSEGTLGIITAACLRLVPAPATSAIAMAAIATPEAALHLLALLRRTAGSDLAACEYISGEALRLALTQFAGLSDPLPTPAPHYLLIELSSPRATAPLRDMLEALLAEALDLAIVTDAVIAENLRQGEKLWRLRESLSEAQQRAGGGIKNDISVPLSRIPACLAQAGAACDALVPGLRILPFGHLGDGNIHFNLLPPDGMAQADFLARGTELMHAVSDVVRALDGSFSAEHGIGQLKTGLLAAWRDGVEMDLMRALKHSFDPGGTLNPGKIFRPR
jgi:FAD/FMN-containing dehydrogenase